MYKETIVRRGSWHSNILTCDVWRFNWKSGRKKCLTGLNIYMQTQTCNIMVSLTNPWLLDWTSYFSWALNACVFLWRFKCVWINCQWIIFNVPLPQCDFFFFSVALNSYGWNPEPQTSGQKNPQKTLILILTGVLLQHIKKMRSKQQTQTLPNRTLLDTIGEIYTVKHTLVFKLNSKYMKFKSYVMLRSVKCLYALLLLFGP